MPAGAGAGRVPRGGRTSALDGLCDLQGGLGGREERGVDDLGLAVQPCADRLGVGLQVCQPERGVGADDGVARDACAEGVLVGVEDEVPYRDGMLGEACADLAPVLLDQDRWSGWTGRLKTTWALKFLDGRPIALSPRCAPMQVGES